MPNLINSKFLTESKTITSTSADESADVIYTVPNNYSSTIRFLHLSNGTGNNKKAYIQFYHKDDNQYHYLANGLAMDANTVQDITGNAYFNLHQGDKIVAYIQSGMILDVTISAEEYYNPNRGTI